MHDTKEAKDGQHRTSITGKSPGEYRKGKTKRDRANNAHSRNAANKDARASWNNLTTMTRHNGTGNNGFPYGTCNGKRNRALKERVKK